jgi:hypothetical protein
MSIFIPTSCQYCPTEIAQGTRCKRCSEQRDGQGVPFIVYCEVWHFQRRPGQQQSFWVYENTVAKTSPAYSSYTNQHISELQTEIERQGYDLIDIVPPLGEIDCDFFRRLKEEKS